jgi:catechol 2,3-dioxygenase-like lactoylglutathione lyase family enzyme
MGMHIIKPLHVAMLVSDLEQSAYFYETVLGLKRCDRPLNYSGVWFELGDYQIHLLQDNDTPNGIHNAQKLGRNRHIALGVADIQQAKDHLLAHHCTVQGSSSGRPAVFTHDPDGNVVELTEI